MLRTLCLLSVVFAAFPAWAQQGGRVVGFAGSTYALTVPPGFHSTSSRGWGPKTRTFEDKTGSLAIVVDQDAFAPAGYLRGTDPYTVRGRAYVSRILREMLRDELPISRFITSGPERINGIDLLTYVFMLRVDDSPDAYVHMAMVPDSGTLFSIMIICAPARGDCSEQGRRVMKGLGRK